MFPTSRFASSPRLLARLLAQVLRPSRSLVCGSLILSSSLCVNLAQAEEAVAPGQLQASRRGATVLLRKSTRPALIDHLARETEPVELEGRDLLLLEAFLTANSRPRRLPRDEYYSNRFAARGLDHDDPVNLTLASSANVSRDEWQRLRTHLLFNRALLGNKPAGN